MGEDDIHRRIDELVAEEPRLRAGHEALDDTTKSQLGQIEASLDQCWDLLRQRRAKREFGEDPDTAAPRDIGTVERYEN